MTNSEYQHVVEFLGRQFTAIDRRFDSLEQRTEEGFREVFRRFDGIYWRLENLDAAPIRSLVEQLERRLRS